MKQKSHTAKGSAEPSAGRPPHWAVLFFIACLDIWHQRSTLRDAPARYTGFTRDLVMPGTALAVVLFPMALHLFGDVFIETFGNIQISIPFIEPPRPPEIEASTRYFFLSAYISLVAAAAGIVLFFANDITSAIGASARVKLVALMSVLVALLAYGVLSRAGDAAKTYDLVGSQLFKQALCASPIKGSDQPKGADRTKRGPGNENADETWSMLNFVMRVGQMVEPDTIAPGACRSLQTPRDDPSGARTLAAVFAPLQKIAAVFMVTAAVAVVLGCISALAHAPIGATRQEQVRALGAQVRRAKAYLYLSALLLVLLVILLISWMEMPSFLLSGDARTRFDGLVRSVATYYGVHYMLILCSFYIPVSLILSGRIRKLAYQTVDGGQRLSEKAVLDWEEKSGLLLQDLRSYKAIAALVAPLFTGIIGSALTAAAH